MRGGTAAGRLSDSAWLAGRLCEMRRAQSNLNVCVDDILFRSFGKSKGLKNPTKLKKR